MVEFLNIKRVKFKHNLINKSIIKVKNKKNNKKRK